MLEIYDTLTQRKNMFVPRVPGKVSMYVCGITVYDYCHIGHARTFVAFDVVVRFLTYLGYDVTFVRNITDIDDKIIQRAIEAKCSVTELTDKFIQAMHEDIESLHVLPASKEPRATKYMDQMLKMIQTLVTKGHAYPAANGDVYYRVKSYDAYGELAHKQLDDLQAGHRALKEDIKEGQKENSLDFVLWKASKPGEPCWHSPWGEGRPGWHIECSAMATDCLGPTLDIHGGGADLNFPHHENERAQSEGATGETFVRNWMHVGFVQVDKQKMSKSLNNFFTIRDVKEHYDAEVIRYFLMSSHYRSQINYSDVAMDAARQSLTRLYSALRGFDVEELKHSNDTPEILLPELTAFEHKFKAVMEDDFNTPQAVAVLFDIAKQANIYKTNDRDMAHAFAAMLVKLGSILGILQKPAELFFKGGETDDVELTAWIASKIQERLDARAAKNFAKADEIRAELLAKGIILEDKAGQTEWRKVNG